MYDKEFIKNINLICFEGEIEKAEELLEEVLVNDSHNIDLLQRLAVVELMPPLADYYKSIAYIEKVLQVDETNPDSLIMMSYIYDRFLGGVDQKLYHKLCKATYPNNEYKSMIELAKSWYYRNVQHDWNQYEKWMINSIKSYPYHVLNYIELAEFYGQKGLISQQNFFVQKGLENIKAVYDLNSYSKIDFTGVDEFLNEHIKGIHLTQENKNRFMRLIS